MRALHLAADAVTDAEREIGSTRVLAAPPSTVYGAFAEPARLARWWGPSGFANEFHEFDLRPGGSWRFTMRDAGGAEYRMEKEFVEVVPGRRIVMDHIDHVHRFRMEIDLAGEDGGTRVSWTMRFESLEEARRVREFIVAANEENFDRLEAELGDGASREATRLGSLE